MEISGNVFHPLAVPQQIDEYFQLLLAKADAIADPLSWTHHRLIMRVDNYASHGRKWAAM